MPGSRFKAMWRIWRPLYARANVVVVPLEVSAGTNIKVLEAMACGKTVVTTPVGCAGLGLEDEENVFIREDSAQFAAAVCEALLNAPCGPEWAREPAARRKRDFPGCRPRGAPTRATRRWLLVGLTAFRSFAASTMRQSTRPLSRRRHHLLHSQGLVSQPLRMSSCGVEDRRRLE